MEVAMVNNKLYESIFDSLLEQVLLSKEALSKNHNLYKTNLAPIFDLGDSTHSLYDSLVSTNEYRAARSIEKLLISMFEQSNITFELYPVDQIYSKMPLSEQRKSLPFSIVMLEDEKRVGYFFC